MPTIRPLADRVLVRVIPAERRTSGGVILPDQVREVTDRGLVVAVGPGAPEMQAAWGANTAPQGAMTGSPSYYPGNRKIPVEEGEVVLFSPYAGSKVAVGDEEYLLLRESDLLGVLDGVRAVEDSATGELRLSDPEPAST